MIDFGLMGRDSQFVGTYYKQAAARANAELHKMDHDYILANNEATLTDLLVEKFGLQRIEIDPDRQITSEPDREVRSTQHPAFRDVIQCYDAVVAVVRIPLVPKDTNDTVQRLTGQNWPGSGLAATAEFDERLHEFIVRAAPQDVKRIIDLFEERMVHINGDIAQYEPWLRSQIDELVARRRGEVTQARGSFDAEMAAAGIRVIRRDSGIEPVNVQVRREVRLLRQPPSRPTSNGEPYIARESLESIIGLLNQGGKGFETAPAAYNKLGEEDLRDILLGYLNAVFERIVATAETFSKRGKTDIFLQVPGGAVLICECQIWTGPIGYVKKLEQMFGYLTFRHTIGVLITFSRVKGLTSAVDNARTAVMADHSCRSGSTQPSSTYFITTHQHPADPAKSFEIHHLMFDLSV